MYNGFGRHAGVANSDYIFPALHVQLLQGCVQSICELTDVYNKVPNSILVENLYEYVEPSYCMHLFRHVI